MLSDERIKQIGQATGLCSILPSDGSGLWLNKLPYEFARAIYAEALKIDLADTPMMTSTVEIGKDNYTIAYWTPVSEGGLDDEITVLMALDENEVAEGYRFDGQWFYTSDMPTNEIPSHWAEMPRHPMDSAP